MLLAFGVALMTALECPTVDRVTETIVAQQGLERAPKEGALLLRHLSDTEIEVELHGPRGTMSRRLPKLTDCTASAELIAAVVGSWQIELAGVSLSLPSLPEEAVPSPRATITATRAARSSFDYEVGAAFLASFAGKLFAPGATAEVRLAKRAFGLGAYVGVEGGGMRSLAIAGGAADWTRIGVRLATGYRVERSRFSFDAIAGLSLVALLIEGRGFQTSRDSTLFDVGLHAGARAGVRLGRLRPFVGVTAAGWLTKVSAFATTNPPDSGPIPRFEVIVVGGVAFLGAR